MGWSSPSFLLKCLVLWKCFPRRLLRLLWNLGKQTTNSDLHNWSMFAYIVPMTPWISSSCCCILLIISRAPLDMSTLTMVLLAVLGKLSCCGNPELKFSEFLGDTLARNDDQQSKLTNKCSCCRCVGELVFPDIQAGSPRPCYLPIGQNCC